jgi:hypothetical protein
VRLEGLGDLKKSNELIGNRTRDLPAYSTVPESTTLPRASIKHSRAKKILKDCGECVIKMICVLNLLRRLSLANETKSLGS